LEQALENRSATEWEKVLVQGSEMALEKALENRSAMEWGKALAQGSVMGWVKG